jgi:hypothetical protein
MDANYHQASAGTTYGGIAFFSGESWHLRRYQFNCRLARAADKKPKRLSEIGLL